jgi:peroxiredoxin
MSGSVKTPRVGLRNLVVIAVTTAAILGGLWLVKTPWAAHDEAGATPDGVSAVDVQVVPGQAAPALGQPAADFMALTTEGQAVALSDLAGQPVWLVFGATWCANCRAEAPDVATVAEAYQGRATVLSLYVGESEATVQGYADRLGLTNPQIPDTSTMVAATYAVVGIPAHFFIDPDGVIRQMRLGTLSEQVASQELDTLLG